MTSMPPTFAATAAEPATSVSSRNYRILWRWHFYAGLFVMPFLMLLAATGSVYVFKPQIERALYAGMMFGPATAGPRLSYERQVAAAARAVPPTATLLSVSVSADATRSTDTIFRLGPGESTSVFVDPHSGAVLGTLSVEHRIMQQVRQLHRDMMLGRTGGLMLELAACWALVMIGTGLALWWPRRSWSVRGTLLPRLHLRGRPLWRELHMVAGAWIAAGAVFLLLTGLPWSGYWGKNFQALVTLGLQAGQPARAQAKVAPKADGAGDEHAEHRARAGTVLAAQHHARPAVQSRAPRTVGDLPLADVPWAFAATPMPQGMGPTPGATLPQARRPLDMDQVAALASARGMHSFQLVLPAGGNGVYTAAYGTSTPGYVRADLRRQRTLHLDQYSGAILKDQGYADLNLVSKAVGYGVALHMGEYFGLANQLISAAISLAVLGMAGSGFAIWWLRRPARALGAPQRVQQATPSLWRWRLYLAALGVVFPLMGASMLAVWLLERLSLRWFRRPAPSAR